MSETIPSNHTKKIEAAKAEVTRARLYRNSGSSREVEPADAWRELDRPGAKLKKFTYAGSTHYVIEVRSDRWYTLH